MFWEKVRETKYSTNNFKVHFTQDVKTSLCYTCKSALLSHYFYLKISLYKPEQYGRKQLGLQSSFFMNRICPLSLRQKKFLSPSTKREETVILKETTHISRACSPMFNTQSTLRKQTILVYKRLNVLDKVLIGEKGRKSSSTSHQIISQSLKKPIVPQNGHIVLSVKTLPIFR